MANFTHLGSMSNISWTTNLTIAIYLSVDFAWPLWILNIIVDNPAGRNSPDTPVWNTGYTSDPFTDCGQGVVSSGGELAIEQWYIQYPTVVNNRALSFHNYNQDNVGVFYSRFDIDTAFESCQLEDSGSGSGTGADPSVATASLSANSLLYGLLGSGYRNAPVTGSGFTMLAEDDAGQYGAGIEYMIDTGAAGSKNVGWTQSADDWAAIYTAFEVTAGGIAVPVMTDLARQRRN